MDLIERLDEVDGPESFLEFVKALIEDRLEEVGKPIDMCGRGENGWENHTIEEFLGAAVAWAESSNFGARELPDNPNPWWRCADFLYSGKIYE